MSNRYVALMLNPSEELGFVPMEIVTDATMPLVVIINSAFLMLRFFRDFRGDFHWAKTRSQP